MNKIISYIGFAIKSGACIMGQTPIKHTQKQVYLILCCNTASENLKNLALNVAKKHNCQVIITNCELQQLVKKDNIKIVALTDKNLSESIIKNKEKISIG